MYGNPIILVLDRPNSNLHNKDNTGLNIEIRTLQRAEQRQSCSRRLVQWPFKSMDFYWHLMQALRRALARKRSL